MSWLKEQAAQPSKKYRELALARQEQLAKPAGSLGQLENLAVTMAGLQCSEKPSCDKIRISVFAADHGVVEESVSAYPRSVTGQMVENFSHGGAAISVIANSLNADLEVINVGTFAELPAMDKVIDRRIAAGTANFTRKSAMTQEQLLKALKVGRETVEVAHAAGTNLWIGGEMGIGNSTSATALACAYLKVTPAQMVGPGAGLDNAGQIHKSAVIHHALQLFSAHAQSPIKDLQYLGGFEIAALAGAYIGAAQLGMPVLVDGFICGVAALYAQAINPSIKPWLLLSHLSAEPGHARVLNALEYRHFLNLQMGLGEGSGAAAAALLLRLACDLHNNMATFTEAGLDPKLPPRVIKPEEVEEELED